MWRCRPPQRLDFITDVEMYLPASWQYVLYGMEFKTQPGAWMARSIAARRRGGNSRRSRSWGSMRSGTCRRIGP